MIPELFKIGPLTVYSYGLMLGIAFIVANYFFSVEIKRRNMNPAIATEITLLAIVFGVVGAKLFHLFENWSDFLLNPIAMAFNPGGLTFYGGLILAALSIYIYTRIKKVPFLTIADLVAPSLMLAYGIGRIGCHLAGDGDYGIPTDLPWGTNYENGTVPPSIMFSNPDILRFYPAILEKYPNGVPDNAPLHPTPIYEFLAAVIVFYILYTLLRRVNWSDGKIFMTYLIMSGFTRFMVEFIRLNPRYMFGLSEAQIISIILMLIGIIGFAIISSRKDIHRFEPVPHQKQPKIKKVKS